ncbi:MAG: NADH-quinone oxidoreductase subunit J [Acidobacteriota bacterium]|nr:NADH-quinone oxidoreductase subunit J [Acidobacteriota bacterium]
MSLAVFAVFASLATISALVVVLHRNPVYSVMSLVVTLVSVAALFVLLGAPFLGALQILVYTGAILVLFLFVIMLLNVGREDTDSGGGGQRVVALIAAALFGGLIALLFWARYQGLRVPTLTPEAVALRPLARELLSTYLLPFEIVGVLLLAAVIAATVLAAKNPPSGGASSS